jgi:hypothetical protein
MHCYDGTRLARPRFAGGCSMFLLTTGGVGPGAAQGGAGRPVLSLPPSFLVAPASLTKRKPKHAPLNLRFQMFGRSPDATAAATSRRPTSMPPGVAASSTQWPVARLGLNTAAGPRRAASRDCSRPESAGIGGLGARRACSPWCQQGARIEAAGPGWKSDCVCGACGPCSQQPPAASLTGSLAETAVETRQKPPLAWRSWPSFRVPHSPCSLLGRPFPNPQPRPRRCH